MYYRHVCKPILIQQVAIDREWTGHSHMFVTLENSKIIGGCRALNMGVQKCKINRCLQLLSRPDGCEFPCRVTVKCYKTVAIVFVILRRCQGTESGRSTKPPFFRCLNPPMISEVHKNNMCAYFLHNLLLLSFAKLIQTVMFNRYHDVRPSTYFTNITFQIAMPWNPPPPPPCCSYQLNIFRKYARFVLGKVRKLQDPSSSRLGDI